MARTEHRDDEHLTCLPMMLVIPTLIPGQPRFARRELRDDASHPSSSLPPLLLLRAALQVIRFPRIPQRGCPSLVHQGPETRYDRSASASEVVPL